MRPKRRLRRALLRSLKYGFYSSAAITVVLAALWWRGTLPNWIQKEIVRGYVRQVQPHLPFQIESLSVDQSWRTLLSGIWSGKVSDLRALIRWGPWRIRLSGPIALKRDQEKGELLVDFSPEATIEPARENPQSGDRSDPVHLDLRLIASSTFTHLSQLSIKAQAVDWKWPHFGIDARRTGIAAEWDGRSAHVELKTHSFSLSQKERTVKLGETEVSANAPLGLKPFLPGPDIQFRWRSAGAEALLGEAYLDLPLGLFPGKGTLHLEPGKEIRIAGADLQLGGGHHPLRLSMGMKPGTGRETVFDLGWEAPSFRVKEFITGLIAAVAQGGGPLGGLSSLGQFDWGDGKLSSKGKAQIAVSPAAEKKVRLLGADATIQADSLRFKPRNSPFSVDGIHLDLAASTATGARATLSIERIRFKKLHARLDPTPIELKPLGSFPHSRFSLLLNHGKDLPLEIRELPIRIGSPKGILRLPIDGKSDFGFELTSSLSSPPLSTEMIGAPLCMAVDRLPKAQVRLDFPKIGLTKESIDPTGKISADLLGGKLEIDEIGLFDLFSEVPETDFNLRLTGVDLSELGGWLGFGEMDGTLNILFQDATFQSWLPTHYDFKLDLKPLHKKKIVFSPEAMKNVIRIFARKDIDRLPFIADFVGFGLPRKLLGGYDIEYGGVSVFSADGLILVETHDPPEIFRREHRHFILYGATQVNLGFRLNISKFMMPFDTKDYPYVIDATAINNYVVDLYRGLTAMAEEKARKKPARKKETSSELFKEDDPECRD